jgi:hypothetical protein
MDISAITISARIHHILQGYPWIFCDVICRYSPMSSQGILQCYLWKDRPICGYSTMLSADILQYYLWIFCRVNRWYPVPSVNIMVYNVMWGITAMLSVDILRGYICRLPGGMFRRNVWSRNCWQRN